MSFLKKKSEPPPLSIDEQLLIGLNRAKNSWLNRSYEESLWKSTNEHRRSQRINTISSLLEFYKRNKYFTTGQQELAKKLINTANER